jgi:hypothetical protein
LSDLFAAEYLRAHLPDGSELPKHTRWLAESIEQHRATQRRPIRPIPATTATPKATKVKRAQRRVLMRSNDPFEVLMSRRTSHVCYTGMIGDDP